MDAHAFARSLLKDFPRPGSIFERQAAIKTRILDVEPRFREGQYSALSAQHLALLFDLIDLHAFAGRIRDLLNDAGHSLTFRLSQRMTHCGGKTTTRVKQGSSKKDFEIAIAPRLIFETFAVQNTAVVTGNICADPLQALTRIMEHETLHLLEMALWNESSCARRRFKLLAERWFGHRESTHRLLTPSERAAKRFAIHVGQTVSFSFAGKTLVGTVNRITSRATVLVPDTTGPRYSDGKRYRKFYVPLKLLDKTM